MFVLGVIVNSIAPAGYAFTADYAALLLFLRIVHGVAFAYDTVLMLTIAGNGRNNVSRAIHRYTTFLALELTAGPVVGALPVMAVGVKKRIWPSL